MSIFHVFGKRIHDLSCISLRFVFRIILVAVYFVLGIFVYYHLNQSNDVVKNSIDLRIPDVQSPVIWVNKKKVVIFAATKFFNMNITTERFLSKCESTKGYCRITEDRNELNISDAVLFHNADYSPEMVPYPRELNRPHVLWSLESPANDRFRPKKDVINWTMTFRRDADIWYPYGHFERLKTPAKVDYEAIWNLKNQSKTATWLASNCETSNNRLDIVHNLIKKGFKVDVFGACGKPAPECDGVDKQGWPCVAELVKPYKFYIAIENSNCLDYVTEKFYETLYSRMAVPIVLLRKYYRKLGIPDSAYLAIDDFDNLDAFIEHAIKVAQDKELYLAHQKWREHFEVKPEHDDTTGFCELCRKLQQTNMGSKSYENLLEWNSVKTCER